MYIPKSYRDIRGGEWIEVPPYGDDPDPEYTAQVSEVLDAIAEFAREFDGEIAEIRVSMNSASNSASGDDAFPFYDTDTDNEDLPF